MLSSLLIIFWFHTGVTSMLDHFVELGIETVWLSPFFKSPMHDMGYDVADFADVDPKFGTMEDLNELIREIKKRGRWICVKSTIYIEGKD